MVKLSGFMSVNADERQSLDEFAPTLEAEESAVIELYERGIHLAAENRYSEAENAFRSVLENSMVLDGLTEQLQRLEKLSIKNLAIAVSRQEGRGQEAVQLFRTAVLKNPSDITLLDKFGTLAAQIGEWNVSKDALFEGLRNDPTHFSIRRKLEQVLRHLGDATAQSAVIASLARVHGPRFSVDKSVLNMIQSLPNPVETEGCNPARGTESQFVTLEISSWMDLLYKISKYLDLGELVDFGIDILQEKSNSGTKKCRVASEQSLKEKEYICEPAAKKIKTQGTIDIAAGEPKTAVRRRTRAAADDEEQMDSNNTSADDKAENQTGDEDEAHATIQDWFDIFQESDVAFTDFAGSDLQGTEEKASSREQPNSELLEALDHVSKTIWDMQDAVFITVLYFSRSHVLKTLKKSDRRILRKLCFHVRRQMPADALLVLSEFLVDEYVEFSKARSIEVGTDLLGPAQGEDSDVLSSILELSKIWLAKYRSSQLDCSRTGSSAVCNCCRYWFATGRLHEALGQVEKANQCFKACLEIVDKANCSIKLEHTLSDKNINQKSVNFKIEILRLHSMICALRKGESGEKLRAVKELSSIMLPCTEQESLMAAADKHTWLEIIKKLSDAALKTGDHLISLRCQIRLVNLCLPAWPMMQDLPKILNNTETAFDTHSVEGQVDQLSSTSLVQALLSASSNLVAIIPKIYATKSIHDFERGLLRNNMRRIVYFMELCKHVLDFRTGPKRSAIKQILLNLSAILVAFWSFDMEFVALDKVFLCIEDLLCSLATHGLLLMGNAMVPYFLTFVLGQIYEHEESIAGFAQKFDKQMQHCIYFTYGIKLPLVELGQLSYFLGEVEVPETGFRGISLIGEVQAIWSYCDKAFSNMSPSMLRAKQGHFIESSYEVALSAVPRAVTNVMKGLLNKFSLTFPTALEDSRSICMHIPLDYNQVLCAEGVPKENVAILSQIFSSIFGYKASIMKKHDQDSLASTQKRWSSKLDENESDLRVEEALYPYIYDIAFNPYRLDSWLGLAESYTSIAEWIMEAYAGKYNMGSVERKRIERYHNISNWCFIFATRSADFEWENSGLYLARQAKLTKAFESFGLSLLDEMSNAPPLYNQWLSAPEQSKTKYRSKLRCALSAFIGGTRVSPERWTNYMHAGICMRSLEYPAEKYLAALAIACELAKSEYGGLIDPIYELHAARLALITNLWSPYSRAFRPNIDVSKQKWLIDVASHYCFEIQDSAPFDHAQAAGFLFDDAIAAMNWCLENRVFYHKARVSLGEAFHDDPKEAYIHLKHLFSKGKPKFAYNMWPISEKENASVRESKKKKRVRREDKRKIDSEFQSQEIAENNFIDGSRFQKEDPISESALKPELKSVSIGLNETNIRIHKGNVRKALLLYISVLDSLGKLDVLSDIESTLEHGNDSSFRPDEYKDIQRICKGCKYVVCLKILDNSLPQEKVMECTKQHKFVVPTFSGTTRNLSGCFGEILGDRRKAIECVFEVWMAYMTTSSVNWYEEVLQPVGMYLSWKLRSAGNVTQKHENLYLTDKGREVIESYAYLYVLFLFEEHRYEDIEKHYDALLSKIHTEKKYKPGVHRFRMFLCRCMVHILSGRKRKLLGKSCGRDMTDYAESSRVDQLEDFNVLLVKFSNTLLYILQDSREYALRNISCQECPRIEEIERIITSFEQDALELLLARKRFQSEAVPEGVTVENAVYESIGKHYIPLSDKNICSEDLRQENIERGLIEGQDGSSLLDEGYESEPETGDNDEGEEEHESGNSLQVGQIQPKTRNDDRTKNDDAENSNMVQVDNSHPTSGEDVKQASGSRLGSMAIQAAMNMYRNQFDS
eukprot:jgi/Picsp_1/2488/NSC_00719-R2_ubiquitin carboxyl-terminal